MAYGDYTGPNKVDKGHKNGSCNRTLCQAPDAVWYNHGSMSWYCADCRRDIQFDDFNLRDWERTHQPQCGHPMFETQAMINERLASEPSDAVAEPVEKAYDLEPDNRTTRRRHAAQSRKGR